ncbi:MAG TPA: paraquat-inducible protein A [Usitatibacter sp.]|nr:paraquat-inducible protein A [Usitatibacter sp.]
MKTNNLTACPECDALQREVTLPLGAGAECVRCGALLYREKTHSLDRMLALMIAAAVVFVCANTFPLMSIDAQGVTSSSTLFGTVLALQETGWPVLALLELLTIVVFPFVQLALALYILVPLKLGFVPTGLAFAVRVLDAVWPWGMLEIFLLGSLVSLVKLTQMATVSPGGGIFMIAGYVVLIAAAISAFEPRALWRRAEELQPEGEWA